MNEIILKRIGALLSVKSIVTLAADRRYSRT